MAKNMSENLSEIKKYIFKLYSSIKKVEVFFVWQTYRSLFKGRKRNKMQWQLIFRSRLLVIQ